jgi:hypothetical protein
MPVVAMTYSCDHQMRYQDDDKPLIARSTGSRPSPGVGVSFANALAWLPPERTCCASWLGYARLPGSELDFSNFSARLIGYSAPPSYYIRLRPRESQLRPCDGLGKRD